MADDIDWQKYDNANNKTIYDGYVPLHQIDKNSWSMSHVSMEETRKDLLKEIDKLRLVLSISRNIFNSIYCFYGIDVEVKTKVRFILKTIDFLFYEFFDQPNNIYNENCSLYLSKSHQVIQEINLLFPYPSFKDNFVSSKKRRS